MNRADIEQVLSSLEAELTAAEKDSDFLVDAIEKIGERVKTLTRAAKQGCVSVPPGFERILPRIKRENDRRHACLSVLRDIDLAINGDFVRNIAQIDTLFQNGLASLEQFIASRKK